MINSSRIQAAVLSLSLLIPGASAFAFPFHHSNPGMHRHGALVGGVAGAALDRHHRVRGAVVGAGVGALVQHERNKHSRRA